MVRLWFHYIASIQHISILIGMVLVEHRSREWSLESLERCIYVPLTPLTGSANGGNEEYRGWGQKQGEALSVYSTSTSTIHLVPSLSPIISLYLSRCWTRGNNKFDCVSCLRHLSGCRTPAVFLSCTLVVEVLLLSLRMTCEEYSLHETRSNPHRGVYSKKQMASPTPID